MPAVPPAARRGGATALAAALAWAGAVTAAPTSAPLPGAATPPASPAMPPAQAPASGQVPAGPFNPLAPAPGGSAVPPPPPLTDQAFATLLRSGDLEALQQGCLQTLAEGRGDRLRQLHERLLAIHPSPQPSSVVLANAEVLLTCKAPEGALTVLDRHGPAPGPGRDRWLLLQWRAATAALDHRRAALALERLTGGRPERLEAVGLPLQQREDGSVVARPALDVLASHLESRGLRRAAAEVLLASQLPGLAGAERLQRAARLLPDLPPEEREALLEKALDQAAAVGAWGLAAELLDEQAALPSPGASARAAERRLRLSARIDDAYGEWLLRRGDPASAARARELEERLRSPRSPGGHGPPPLSEAADAPLPTGTPEGTDSAAPVKATGSGGKRPPQPAPDAAQPLPTYAPNP